MCRPASVSVSLPSPSAKAFPLRPPDGPSSCKRCPFRSPSSASSVAFLSLSLLSSRRRSSPFLCCSKQSSLRSMGVAPLQDSGCRQRCGRVGAGAVSSVVKALGRSSSRAFPRYIVGSCDRYRAAGRSGRHAGGRIPYSTGLRAAVRGGQASSGAFAPQALLCQLPGPAALLPTSTSTQGWRQAALSSCKAGGVEGRASPLGRLEMPAPGSNANARICIGSSSGKASLCPPGEEVLTSRLRRW